MKPYIRVSAAFVLAAICLMLRPAKSTTQVKIFTADEAKYYTWLGHRLDEAYSVQVGMSRADLLKVFEPDGGLQRIPPRRYILQNCNMIKVDVEFELPQGASRADLPPDNELKICAISKPYLERAIAD